jgi:hypothetical protein
VLFWDSPDGVRLACCRHRGGQSRDRGPCRLLFGVGGGAIIVPVLYGQFGPGSIGRKPTDMLSARRGGYRPPVVASKTP